MKNEDDVIYRFEQFEFCARTAELRKIGKSISLSLPARAALTVLLQNRNRIVTRDELTKAVWPDAVVSEGSLRLAIWEIRRAVGDSGNDQSTIRTLRGRGYRFGATCEVIEHRPPQLQAQSRPALTGRLREQELLQQAVHDANTSGRAALLVGPPGVGKTRLARAVTAFARERGFATIAVHGEPHDAAPGLAPWFQALVQCVQGMSSAQRQRAEHQGPLLFRVLDARFEETAAVSAFLSGELQRSMLLEELAHTLIRSSDAQPLLIFVDDLHWLDEASLAFFVYLARHASRGRLLLMGSCRSPTKRETQLKRALDRCAREPDNQLMTLEGLTLFETQTMLGLDDSPSDRELAHQMYALTSGNPLFTSELRKLLDNVPAAQRNHILSGEHVALHTVIGQRLSRLEESVATTVGAAAVLSSSFAAEELAAVLAVRVEDVLRPLDDCIHEGVLVGEGARYNFAHPLLRDVSYLRLTLEERATFHKRIAQWLDRHASGVVSRPELSAIAHHCYHARALGVADRAIHYLVRLAHAAIEATAYHDAVHAYQMALECCRADPPAPATRVLALEIERAQALRWSGTSAAQLKDLLAQLADRAQHVGAPELLARAVLVYTGQSPAGLQATRFPGTSDPRELALIDRALRALDDTPSELRVLLLCSLSFALLSSRDLERRKTIADRAVALAAQLALPWLHARALSVRCYACASPSEHAHRLVTSSELVDLTVRHGLKQLEMEGRLIRAICLLEQCDAGQASHDEARALQLAQELRPTKPMQRARVPALLRAFSEGRLREAELLTEQARQAAPDDQLAAMLHMVRAASLRLLRGGLTADTLTFHEQLAATNPEIAGFRCSLASLYAAFGKPELALVHFDWVAGEDFAALPFDINWLTEMSLLADTAVSLDDAARARLVFGRLVAFGDRWMFFAGEAAPAGPVAHWLAELSTTQRDAQAAQHWLARARQLCERMNASLFLQYNALAEARLIFLCMPEQAARAGRLLQQVTDFATQRDVAWLRTCALAMQHRFAQQLQPSRVPSHRQSN